MNSIQLLELFHKLLFKLEPVFTRPSFQYFQALILGILLGRPKKTVTAAVKPPSCSSIFPMSIDLSAHTFGTQL